MAGEISGLTLDHRAPEGVEIKEVESLEELRAWNEATAGLFGFPDFAARAGLDMYAHVGLGPESLWRHFIAEVDGEVAAVASLFTGPEAAMACGVAVAPGYRSRGLASVMTARTAKEAANAGYKVLTVLALAQAEGLYRRLGLKTFCRGEVYLWKGQAEPYDMDDSELTFSEPASKIRPQPQEQPTQGGSMNQETKQNQQQDPDQEPRLDLSFTRSTKDIASAAFIGALIAVVTLVVIYFVFREDISRYDKRIGAVEKQLRQDVRELRTSMNDRVSALESKLEGIEDLPQKVRAQILMDTLSEMRSRAVFLETQVDDPELKSRIEELQKSFTEIESGIKP
jgi:GNAT superfamily N-acetyltransferase